MDAYSVHNVTPGTAPRGTPDCTVRYRDTRRCVAATLGARLHAALPRPAPGCGNAKNTTFEPRSISSNYVYTAEGTQNIGGGGGVSPHTGCFFFPREGGAPGPVLSSVRPSVSGSRTRFPPRNGGPELAARIAQKLDFFGPWPRPARLEGPVCPLSVCGSVTGPPKSTENPQGSLRFWRFPPLVLASRSPMLPRSVSAGWRTRCPLRNGVSEFSELSGQISQELDFGGSLARGLVPWPGGWRCLAGAQASAAVPQNAAAFLGPDGQQIENNDHASSNSDLKSGVIPILHVLGICSKIFSRRLAPRAGPGPRQSQGSARAGAGQSVGQSHCRAWQQL
eukprot:gene25310-biopygen20966